jgi:membrane protease subunit (stomatin/prohibitin family)
MLSSLKPGTDATGPIAAAQPALSGGAVQTASDTKFCIECGHAIPQRAKFCTECGKAQ